MDPRPDNQETGIFCFADLAENHHPLGVVFRLEQDTGVDLHFPSENRGADAVQPASGGSPPDCRI